MRTGSTIIHMHTNGIFGTDKYVYIYIQFTSIHKTNFIPVVFLADRLLSIKMVGLFGAIAATGFCVYFYK